VMTSLDDPLGFVELTQAIVLSLPARSFAGQAFDETTAYSSTTP